MPSGYIKDLEGNRIEIVDAQARSGLQGKQDKLTAGRNISISNNIISADDTTVTQTLTSGTEIGKVNDTSLFAPTVNYVDAGTNANGDIVFYGGNAESANITQAVQLAKTELQTSIGEKYTKPSGGIPETDLSEDLQTKIDSIESKEWKLIADVTTEEEIAYFNFSEYSDGTAMDVKDFIFRMTIPAKSATGNILIAMTLNCVYGAWAYSALSSSSVTYNNSSNGVFVLRCDSSYDGLFDEIPRNVRSLYGHSTGFDRSMSNVYEYLIPTSYHYSWETKNITSICVGSGGANGGNGNESPKLPVGTRIKIYGINW